jgi:hypothetical protein
MLALDDHLELAESALAVKIRSPIKQLKQKIVDVLKFEACDAGEAGSSWKDSLESHLLRSSQSLKHSG